VVVSDMVVVVTVEVGVAKQGNLRLSRGPSLVVATAANKPLVSSNHKNQNI
jgi:hypothetical protein